MSLQNLRRLATTSVISGAMLLSFAVPAHADESANPVPVIALQPKNAPAKPATTTTAPQSIQVQQVPSISNNGTAQPLTATPVAPVSAVTTTTVAPSAAASPSTADNSAKNLAHTGFGALRLTGLAMLLTAMGMALLAFTGAAARLEQIVRSLVPSQSLRK